MENAVISDGTTPYDVDELCDPDELYDRVEQFDISGVGRPWRPYGLSESYESDEGWLWYARNDGDERLDYPTIYRHRG